MDTYFEISEEMKQIEVSLATLEPKWAEASRRLIRLQGRHALREAQLRLSFKGTGTVPEIAAHVVDALWKEPTDLMASLTEAEAEVAAHLATYKTLDRRLSSLQSRLNAVMKVELNPAA